MRQPSAHNPAALTGQAIPEIGDSSSLSIRLVLEKNSAIQPKVSGQILTR
jgi:hypothetical protein